VASSCGIHIDMYKAIYAMHACRVPDGELCAVIVLHCHDSATSACVTRTAYRSRDCDIMQGALEALCFRVYTFVYTFNTFIMFTIQHSYSSLITANVPPNSNIL